MLRIYPGIHHLLKPDGKSMGLYKQDNEPTSAKLIKLTEKFHRSPGHGSNSVEPNTGKVGSK